MTEKQLLIDCRDELVNGGFVPRWPLIHRLDAAIAKQYSALAQPAPQVEPVAYVRLVNGEIDWGEDYLSPEKGDVLDGYEDDGESVYSERALVFADPHSPQQQARVKVTDEMLVIAWSAWNQCPDESANAMMRAALEAVFDMVNRHD